MAAGDQGAAAPGRGIPLWVWGAGVGAVVLFLYLRRRQGASTVQTPISGGVVTDPNTGFPVDPVSGLPFVTSQPTTTTDLATWAQNAMKALVGAGYSPALASQSIYDYQVGNQLNAQESDAVNKALGLVGFPPISLPFFGNIPPTPGNVAPKRPPFITYPAWRALAASARKLWAPITTAGGAHGFIPQGWALPAGAKWGKGYTPPTTATSQSFPHPIFAPVPTTTTNGSKLIPFTPPASVVPIPSTAA